MAISLTFLTLAIPIQLNGNWITLAWAVEGAALLYASFPVKYRKLRTGSLIILALAVIRLLFFDLENLFSSGMAAVDKRTGFTPFINSGSLMFLAGVLILFAASFIYGRYRNALESKFERHMAAVIAIGANILIILFLAANTSAYFDYLIYKNNFAYPIPGDLENTRQFAYSAILILYSMITTAAGFAFKIRYLRLFSFVLFLVSIIKVFFFDLSILERGYRIMSFVLLGLILLGVSYLYQRYKYIILGVVDNEIEK
jgi:hypothetical protein